MNLCETMVKPGGYDNRVVVRVGRKPFEQVGHFAIYMNRWTVLVHSSIGSLWIVRLLFVFPPQQGNLKTIADLVNCCCCFLMLSEDCVKFVDQTFRKISGFPNAVDHKLNCCFLISQKIDEMRWFDVCIGARYEFFSKAMRNQCFCSPSVKIVKAF